MDGLGVLTVTFSGPGTSHDLKITLTITHTSLPSSLKFHHQYFIPLCLQGIPFKMQIIHVNERETLSDSLHPCITQGKCKPTFIERKL